MSKLSRAVVLLALAARALGGGPLANVAAVQPEQTNGVQSRDLASLRTVWAEPESQGTVELGAVVRRRIQFQNVLNVPVSLDIVSTTCGCIEARFGSNSLASGDSTVLTIGTQSSPLPGVQSHSVVFRITWREDGADRAERGMCSLSYTPKLAFVVRPERVALAGVEGERTGFDVFIRVLEKDVNLDPGVPTVTLPGWTVVRREGLGLPRGVQRFHVEGPVGSPGFVEAEVSWATALNAEPSIRVPLRLRSLSPLRSVPGGATIVRNAEDGQARATLRLFVRRKESAAPASIRIVTPCEWLSARLISAHEVEIALSPMPEMLSIGSNRGELLSADGTVLMTFPIVWYTRSEAEKASIRTEASQPSR